MRDRGVTMYGSRKGYLSEYSFSYSKIGVDNTGKGNIQPESGEKVWGVFYRITTKDYHHLHRNYEVGYRKITVEGISNKKTLQAKTFTALPKKTSHNLQPSQNYYDIVLKGAREHNLPEEHIRVLETI